MVLTAAAILVAVAALIAVGIAAARARAVGRRHRVLLEHLPQTSVMLFDHDLRFRLVVGGALLRAGVDPKQIQGKLLWELFSGEQGEELAHHFKAALHGESSSLEYTARRDGREYWLDVVPVQEGGRVTGGMAVAQEITERKAAERDHELAEGRRRLTIDAMNEAYVAIDRDGTVLDWNPRAEQLFGFSAAEAVGRRTTDLLIPPEDHGDFDGLIDRYLDPAKEPPPLDLRAERTAVHRDGRRFTVELAAATYDHQGTIVLHTFMHDISDRKRAEADAIQHATELEAIAKASGALARSTDPEEAREAICGAAMTVAGASIAALFEPEPGGRGLVPTASVGAEATVGLLPFVGPLSGAVRTYTSNEALFVGDLAEPGAGVVRWMDKRSAYWAPVRAGNAPLGVIVVAWDDPLEELPAGLTRVMELVAAEAAVAIDRAALLDRLARMARTDDLTGLPNRRAWDQEMVREVARAKRAETPLTVAMVDLDFFKSYNDAHGHQAGDRLLKEAAGAWRAVLRETDLLARYGGEEFAIALPGCSLEEAERLVERLRAVTPRGESCSAGIAAWNRKEHAEALLGRADEALYEAKQAGRNRTVTA